jgi:hypothetical protein
MPRQRAIRFQDQERTPVTDRAVELFKRALKLETDKVDRDYREWLNISVELHREFGLKLWDTNILDVQIDHDPPEAFLRDEAKLQSWRQAKKLRMRLISLT